MAVIILDPDEHRRPIQHPAERGDDRRRQRIAIAEGLELADGKGRRCHFCNPRARPSTVDRLLYGHPIYNMTWPVSTAIAAGRNGMDGSVARRFLLGLAPWVGAVALWYGVRWSGFVNVSLIPAPHQVAAKFVELLLHEGLLVDVFASTRRVFLGRHARHSRRRSRRLPARLVPVGPHLRRSDDQFLSRAAADRADPAGDRLFRRR